jgi:hypothetical protein
VVAASGRRVGIIGDGSLFTGRRPAPDVRGLAFPSPSPWRSGGRCCIRGPGRGGGQSSAGGTHACHGKDQRAG